MTSADGMKVLCVRLVRGDDLKVKLRALVEENNIRAGFIVSCVGSVSQATLRFATQVNGEHEIRTLSQNMEITSLVGTFSQDGCHLHMTLSDDQGHVIGGHLMSDCIVQTTAEVVIGYLDQVRFERTYDPDTGFKELVVSPCDKK
ncbi:hypothetical protein M8J76_016469 [Diaphorina citri]|nr:hypothetical protein M8J76_016469 [Diaphorina citri]